MSEGVKSPLDSCSEKEKLDTGFHRYDKIKIATTPKSVMAMTNYIRRRYAYSN
ncbi:MAG: hypothetical protein ACLPSL_05775 [Smithella sp.]